VKSVKSVVSYFLPRRPFLRPISLKAAPPPPSSDGGGLLKVSEEIDGGGSVVVEENRKPLISLIPGGCRQLPRGVSGFVCSHVNK
jgi:hypothetical protein